MAELSLEATAEGSLVGVVEGAAVTVAVGLAVGPAVSVVAGFDVGSAGLSPPRTSMNTPTIAATATTPQITIGTGLRFFSATGTGAA